MKSQKKWFTRPSVIVLAVTLVLYIVIVIRVRNRLARISNEQGAIAALHQLEHSPGKWRALYDSSGTMSYHVSNIHSFYTAIHPYHIPQRELKLIDIALAKADVEGSAIPKMGYLFGVLRTDESGKTPYSVKSRYIFGFYAFPAAYGDTGIRTFVIYQNNNHYSKGTVYSKDIGEERPKRYPGLDPTTSGWEVEPRP